MAQIKCKHCHREIKKYYNEYYHKLSWYHIHNNHMWCGEYAGDKTLHATPTYRKQILERILNYKHINKINHENI
jgi:hypothetical protein